MWERAGQPGFSVKRFPFLDWMRGLAVVIMIQCHTFNSFTRMDLRDGGPYVLTQFIGGMAAPLFLFMAGMTTGIPDGEPGAARAQPLAPLADFAQARGLHPRHRVHLPLHQLGVQHAARRAPRN